MARVEQRKIGVLIQAYLNVKGVRYLRQGFVSWMYIVFPTDAARLYICIEDYHLFTTFISTILQLSQQTKIRTG